MTESTDVETQKQKMYYRMLGNTGLQVSVLAYGKLVAKDTLFVLELISLLHTMAFIQDFGPPLVPRRT